MNPTDDEIRVKCAEAMGWLNIHPSGRLDGQKIGTNPACPIIGEYEEIPNYPASVDAALTLCDRLREEGWAFVADNGGAEWEVEFFRKATPHDIIRVVNPSLPKAICVAFLRIKES